VNVSPSHVSGAASRAAREITSESRDATPRAAYALHSESGERSA
jgi:hypothetical protein